MQYVIQNPRSKSDWPLKRSSVWMEIFWTYLQSYQVYNDICTVNILLVYMYRWYSGGHVTGHMISIPVWGCCRCCPWQERNDARLFIVCRNSRCVYDHGDAILYVFYMYLRLNKTKWNNWSCLHVFFQV